MWGVTTIYAIKVRKDSHIFYKNKYYSVAEEYIGKQVNVQEQKDIVLIYYRAKLIESHQKLVNRFQTASTKQEHLGTWQKALLPGSVYRKAARAIGPNCDELIQMLLARGRGVVPNQEIWGILNLQDKYNRTSLEEACGYVLKHDMADYRGLSMLLSLRYRKVSKAS